jgi:anaerobic magnesium-protoporphyrin IX monomethyl ester cyclase
VPTRNIVFVAFQDQPNLGIGYLTSTLHRHDFDVELLDFRSGPEAILERIRELDPLLIGLSIIYQYYTPDFAELTRELREHGVTCPICAGGHFPSLEPVTTLELIPDLDLIVRFEGEYTLLEIAKRLQDGLDWKDVRSIAYSENGSTVTTPLRPLISDLDELPFPRRWALDYHCLGVPATSILASRGCPRGCSFCSIRRFYSIPPGRVRRTRSPENVIEEMLQLYHERDVRIFLFQDDDFSLMSKRDRDWSWHFVECLKKSELQGKVLWKISCRSDEVEPEIFAALKSAGLYLVYLGIESGNETGLKTLNKQISVEQNLQAVRILKSLGLRYDFGFMLFDPTSTIDLVLENIRFLREICGDGSATASFGKTLPYAGTDLEMELREQGRLSGDVRFPDYGFSDSQTESWFDYLCRVFYPWVYGNQCLQAQLRWAMFELDVMRQFYRGTPDLDKHQEMINYLVHWYNEIFFRIVEDSAGIFRSPRWASSSAERSIHQSAEEQRLWLEDQLALQRQRFFTKSGLPLELVVGEIEHQP